MELSSVAKLGLAKSSEACSRTISTSDMKHLWRGSILKAIRVEALSTVPLPFLFSLKPFSAAWLQHLIRRKTSAYRGYAGQDRHPAPWSRCFHDQAQRSDINEIDNSLADAQRYFCV